MSFRDLENTVLGLCNEVMGTDVSYTPNGESPVSIKGVFDNAYVDIEGIVSLKPILRINLSDLDSAPARLDTVEIDSVSYRILESREDAFGGSTLILQRE